ncbi:MAG: class I SAM-dependent methyltransferase [Deltaproteobacteria bacterium]|nr:class I SAM-dependent methyltransferase [Deltaproteobacteria bacterium]
MVDHRHVYAAAADDYDRLVEAEDADGRLGPALDSIAALEGADVLEVGVGTGRITRLLLDRGARVVGCEPAAAMRQVALSRLAAAVASRRLELLPLAVQDLVVDPSSFDLALAGWVLGHFVSWHAPRWRDEIGAALDRMVQALRPSGTLVVIETLGTGETRPRPPDAGLAEYQAWLEDDRGFVRTVIRTDYRFDDVETAARVTGRFFGDAFAERVRNERWTTVPECTGIWVRSDAVALLRRYVELHNRGVTGGDFGPMIALFDENAQMRFEGIPFGPLDGRRQILDAFDASPPSDELDLIDVAPTAGGAHASYAWRTRPGDRAGTLGITASAGKISRLVVTAW